MATWVGNRVGGLQIHMVVAGRITPPIQPPQKHHELVSHTPELQAPRPRCPRRNRRHRVADPAGEVRSHGNIPAHTHALDKLHRRLSEGGVDVRYVYEAGPTGFALCRHLRAKGIVCELVSPSLIPKRASERVNV